MTRAARKRINRRPRWVVPVGIVAAVAIVATAIIFIPNLTSQQPVPSSSAAAPSPSPTPTPTPTPTVATPVVVGNNFAPATFENWTTDGALGGPTRFSVDRDSFHDGATSLRVDSSAKSGDKQQRLSQTIAVQPATTYNFSAWVQSPELSDGSQPVEVRMGEGGVKIFSLPSGAADWTLVSWEYSTGAKQVSLAVAISPTGPTPGFRIDQLSAVPVGGDVTTVANGSFDRFSTPSTSIMDDATIYQTGANGINVAWKADAVDWVISDAQGTSLKSGSLPVIGGMVTVPLTDVVQGYYGVSLSAPSDPGVSIDTSFAVLDAASVSDERFGVGAHIGEDYYVGSETAAAAVGFSGMRTDAYWARNETAKGVYNYHVDYEEAFPAFKKLGIDVLPISNGANKLYDSGKIPTSKGAVAAYGAYTADLAEHYGSKAVEIFNELNTQRFNNSTCGVGADCYYPLLKASYDAVKAKHPETLILGPANGNQDDPFLTELYRIGGLNALDVVTYHPYVSAPEQLAADIQQAQARIKEYNNGNSKPIWLTEFGWTASGGISEQTQADYLVRAEATALANGIEKLFWYDLVNDEVDPKSHEGNFGLFRRATATTPFEPKPAAVAQALLIRKVAGKPYVSADPVGGSFSYVFGKGDSATRIAWATTPAYATYQATGTVTVTTSMGAVSKLEAVNGQVTVQLSDQPVYVEGNVTSSAGG